MTNEHEAGRRRYVEPMESSDLDGPVTEASVRNVIASLQRSLDSRHLCLRIDHDNLESVYLSIEGDVLTAEDRGETFYFLSVTEPESGGRTYVPWSESRSREIAAEFGATLLDESEPHVGAGRIRIVINVSRAADVRRSVDAVAGAIDAIFRAHLRSDP